jgi:hypothetical protein
MESELQIEALAAQVKTINQNPSMPSSVVTIDIPSNVSHPSLPHNLNRPNYGRQREGVRKIQSEKERRERSGW